jgi:hypothetical protein
MYKKELRGLAFDNSVASLPGFNVKSYFVQHVV